MTTTLDKIREDLSNEISTIRKAKSRRRKLDAALALQVRLMHVAGHSTQEIANEVNCTPRNVRYVINRETWKNV